jgi:hypothetical protein
MNAEATQADDEERPWERPGAIRRDREPHRGLLLAVLGGVCLAFAALAICVPFSGLLAMPAALATHSLVRHDLTEMHVGRMDPAGQRQAHRAKARTIAAMWVSGFNILLTATALGFGLFR